MSKAEYITISAHEQGSAPSEVKAVLAVFDFDGTSVECHSPVRLVKYLIKKGMLKPGIILRIAGWALAYNFHLPQNEAGVRGLVFSAFEGQPQEQVDRFLREFYDEVVEPCFREQMQALIDEHKRAGEDVIVVSATFEPIVLRAQELHGYNHVIAVRMQVDEQGNYTREILGEPIEGEAKVRAIQAYGDKRYGAGNWKIGFVYADHYSDIPLMELAQKPYAVCPGPSLKREAKKRGWEILDWDSKQSSTAVD